jgi:hypothetical protein
MSVLASILVGGAAIPVGALPDPPRLRIVDARDGRAIEGAVVELWTEEGVKPHIASAQLATLRTGADGTHAFEHEIDGRRVDAARVTCAGYGSRSVAASDLEDGVRLWPAIQLAGRVVDLEGRPVADALVRSEPGPCRHAVPGTQTRTATDGTFRFDDLSESDVLQVIPREHVPLGSLPLATLSRLAERDGTVDVHVATRATLRMRLVGERGEPLARRRVHQNFEDLFVATWTDDAGVVTLPPPALVDAQVTVFEGAAECNVEPFVPRGDGLFTRKPMPLQHADGEGRLTIEVRAPAGAGRVPSALLAAADGSAWSNASPEGIALGPATLHFGADFSPWLERSVAVEVTRHPQIVSITAERAPLVRVLVPAASVSSAWVHVQAGPTGSSVLEQGERVESGHVFRRHVPAAQPVHVVVVGFDGEIRAGRLAPLAPGTEVEIDLRPATCVVRAGVLDPDDERGDAEPALELR